MNRQNQFIRNSGDNRTGMNLLIGGRQPAFIKPGKAEWLSGLKAEGEIFLPFLYSPATSSIRKESKMKDKSVKRTKRPHIGKSQIIV
ncbi:hypothetical cytosolic protein [Syntrophus aciditrophicus SB]|uniref:Hypothetical cytosolic protein n=1 Tax=Syntrophus aciditrophicus (strain SB) TaxID=56780 RepID=Q2LVE1_SYNAS|nr:hypothetical cytosolic protein [Syntrophus aciditrophicus SB]